MDFLAFGIAGITNSKGIVMQKSQNVTSPEGELAKLVLL